MKIKVFTLKLLIMTVISCQAQSSVKEQKSINKSVVALAFFTHTTSKLKVTALFDGILYLHRNEIVNLSDDKIESLITKNTEREVDEGIVTSINTFLVEQNGEYALVDVGAGNNYDGFNPGLGNVEKSLRMMDIDPKEIKHIFLTHNHDDHTGGLVDKKGNAIYPNATLWFNKVEAPSGLFNADIRPYSKADRIKYFNIGDKLPLDAQAIPTYGHTRGHTAFLFGSEVLVWGDVVHFQDVQFSEIQAGTVYDSNSKQAATTRQNIMEQAMQNKWIVAGAHLDYPGLGRVEKGENARSFQWRILNDYNEKGI